MKMHWSAVQKINNQSIRLYMIISLQWRLLLLLLLLLLLSSTFCVHCISTYLLLSACFIPLLQLSKLSASENGEKWRIKSSRLTAIFSVTPIKSIFFYLPRWQRVTLLFFCCYSWSWDSFTTWAWARDLHRRCIYYPSPTHSVMRGYITWCVSYPEHVYTWEGYSNLSVSSCVCVCVCLCVSIHLIASWLLLVLPSIQLVVSSVLFHGTFLRVSIYPFKLSCPASWLFRLLLSASFLVVAMIFSLVIFCHFLSHAYQINFLTCEDGGEWIFLRLGHGCGEGFAS